MQTRSKANKIKNESKESKEKEISLKTEESEVIYDEYYLMDKKTNRQIPL